MENAKLYGWLDPSGSLEQLELGKLPSDQVKKLVMSNLEILRFRLNGAQQDLTRCIQCLEGLQELFSVMTSEDGSPSSPPSTT